MAQIWTIALCLLALSEAILADQTVIDYLASNIQIEYHVIDNLGSGRTYSGMIVMENTGPSEVTHIDWSLYFTSIKMFEAGSIRPNGTDLGTTGLRIYHINGGLHRIAPSETFPGFQAGERLSISFSAASSQVTAVETMPNWYFTAPGDEPRVCTSTAGEDDRSWIGAFNTPNQWKRSNADQYDPYTGPVRFDKTTQTDLGSAQKNIIPTTVNEGLDYGGTVNIDTGDWLVVVGDPRVQSEAELLANALGIVAVDPQFTPASRYILVTIGDVIDDESQVITTAESYRVNVHVTNETLDITGIDTAGAFYGVQSLLSLYEASVDIPAGFLVDYPRFHYRGMHLDVSRNFKGKGDVMRLLDVMAMYKLNKFHFHLTDDEGWRVEIPGLPELTEIGASRCHDVTAEFCIVPQYGSAPGLASVGTGFYSVADYREILAYANERHIEVIPEFDMPGHANAAIKATNKRYRDYESSNITAALEYLLVDLEDTSDYLSVQNMINNGMNPCVESTYTFVAKVAREIQAMHADIQPLTTYNFGGDEVPHGAWEGSPACAGETVPTLKEYFGTRVSQIVAGLGMDLSGWGDAFLGAGNVPYDISSFATDNVNGYIWNNLYEQGSGNKAYILANAGYNIILSPATHFYFDHPYEPDPYDRGLYWATRVTSTSKVFGFMPDNYYDNMGDDLNGNPIDKENICNTFGCIPLDPGSEDNVLGIQGQLWTETVRTSGQMDYMIFPRLLALAERAWHKSNWEFEADEVVQDTMRTEDWERFTNTLGYKELARLDSRGVQYAVNPPGARIAAFNRLEAKAEYPGLPIQYSTDGGDTWSDYTDNLTMQPGTVQVITKSADGSRSSRVVEMTVI